MADEQPLFDVPEPEGDGADRRPKKEVSPEALGDNETYDYINGGVVKLTEAERVRQRIAEVLVHSYHIDPRDLDRDFPIKVETDSGRKQTRKASIAVFEAGKPHHVEHLRRVVVTKPAPRASKTVAKIRSYEQAKKDLGELEELMAAVKSCEYGLWTDDVDLYFVHKIDKRFEPDFKPLPNWPMGDETFDATRDASALAEMRRADRHMLKFAFRRCHNYIHGNEGLPKDAAFWQFLYVLFAKTYDERMGRERPGYVRRFRVDVEDLNGPEGRRVLAERVKELFGEVKAHYAEQELFTPRDEITLSDSAIAFITGELAPFDLATTDIDAKGVAYQELVGGNLRGDRGQYFTPHDAVRLVVEILDPQEGETVFDPCCGTGGFLRETVDHLLRRWKKEERTAGEPETAEDLTEHRRRLAEFAEKHLFGADFDPFLRRAASMSIMMLTDTAGHVFNMDSLAFPEGHLPGVEPARAAVPLGSVDVLMTNPPFGSDIPITDPAILGQYSGKRHSVAGVWARDRETGELYESGISKAVSPEQLFVQRAIEWVHPGGRIGIVLPNGILSNPGPADENVRRHILHECWVLASVELPVETFIVEANVNILTTLLFLRRKTEAEKNREANRIAEYGRPEDYPVFMAVAEKVGVDRRGNPVYVRNPDGTAVTEIIERSETFWRQGRKEVRTIRHRQQKIDNDLLVIGGKYAEFVAEWQHEFPWNR